MNLFLNNNWEVILDELKPAFRKALAQIIGGFMGGVFEKLPYNDLFIDTDGSWWAPSVIIYNPMNANLFFVENNSIIN